MIGSSGFSDCSFLQPRGEPADKRKTEQAMPPVGGSLLKSGQPNRTILPISATSSFSSSHKHLTTISIIIFKGDVNVHVREGAYSRNVLDFDIFGFSCDLLEIVTFLARFLPGKSDREYECFIF